MNLVLWQSRYVIFNNFQILFIYISRANLVTNNFVSRYLMMYLPEIVVTYLFYFLFLDRKRYQEQLVLEKIRHDKADKQAREEARQAELEKDIKIENEYLAKTKVIVKAAREAREQDDVSDAVRSIIDLTIDGLGN